jgi:hypothetical protein
VIDVGRIGTYAQLAEASYVLWDQVFGAIDQSIQLALQNDSLGGGFSASQAANVAATWSLLHHVSNTSAGFSATAFESKSMPGTLVLAVRGSDQRIEDLILSGSGDIVLDGIAIDQVVDLYNFWMSLTAIGLYTAASLVKLNEETQALQNAYLVSSSAGASLEAEYRERGLIVDYGAELLVRM